MIHIDELLLCDIENITITKQNLVAIAPSVLDAIEAGSVAFESMARKYGEVCRYSEHNEVFAEWARRSGFDGADHMKFLGKARLIGSTRENDDTKAAQEGLYRAAAVISRSHLGLRLKRDYMYGITDLLRLRLSQAMGLLRVQSETAALMAMTALNPKLGHDWLATADDEAGREFHKRFHSTIVEKIRSMGLYDGYSRGSNMALHSRASGTALGTLLGAKSERNRGTIKLIYQEVDDPRTLLIWTAIYLRFHRLVLDQSAQLYPELNEQLDGIEGLSEFLKKEEEVRNCAIAVREKLGLSGILELLSG